MQVTVVGRPERPNHSDLFRRPVKIWAERVAEGVGETRPTSSIFPLRAYRFGERRRWDVAIFVLFSCSTVRRLHLKKLIKGKKKTANRERDKIVRELSWLKVKGRPEKVGSSSETLPSARFL